MSFLCFRFDFSVLIDFRFAFYFEFVFQILDLILDFIICIIISFVLSILNYLTLAADLQQPYKNVCECSIFCSSLVWMSWSWQMYFFCYSKVSLTFWFWILYLLYFDDTVVLVWKFLQFIGEMTFGIISCFPVISTLIAHNIIIRTPWLSN